MNTTLERVIPLTPAQEEIFAASMVDPKENISFNESLSWHIEGPVDSEKVLLAINKLILRHEALRASFSPDGRCSLIAKTSLPNYEYYELSDRDIDALITKETDTPFDLLAGPLYRFKLLKKVDGSHVLVLTLHHIICDGWSIAILMRDLKLIYEGKDLPKVASYAEYVLNEKAYLETSDYQKELDYWRQTFSTIPPIAELPLKGERPRFRSSDSDRIDYKIDAETTKAIELFARKQKVSLTVAMLAVFRWALAIKTKSPHINIGIAAAGQSKTGSYDLVGHCVQLLPSYIQVPSDMNFDDFLKLEKKIMLDAYDNQSVTFGTIVKELKIAKDLSRIPLLPFKFNVDMKLAANEVELDSYPASYDTNPRSSEAFEFYINMSKDETGMLVETQYNTTLFSKEMTEGFLTDFDTMIQSLIANPKQNLSAFEYDETRLVDYPFNRTETSYNKEAYLHDMLLEQFTKRSQKVAIYTETKATTYQELSSKSQTIAQHLLNMGVKEGDSVAICCKRSGDMVAAMIGTLLCGATYIPMDPGFPKERLAYMVEDTDLTIILSDLDDHSLLPDVRSVVDIRSLQELHFSAPKLTRSSNDLLAYMIFTSGSTGRPKGVMVQHRAVHNFLDAVSSAINFTESETVLAVTTISFDISVLEIFLGLFKGASIYLASKEEASNGDLLKSIISKNNITMMQGTPSTWKILLGSDFQSPTGFRALCGGEPLSRNLAKELSANCFELWNMYGPTEATVWSSCELIKKDFKKITVGKPLNNYQYYILDGDLNCAPIGVKGDLYIAGDSVSKGYLLREELTKETFITVDNKLLYKTGDIAKFDNESNVELFGRGDYQVKIRGYRIELGEIEENIKDLSGMTDCIVKVYELSEDDKRIVAYYTATSAIDQKAIRAGLMAKSLPPYMIPNKFIQLDAMPLLPNGKINRKELLSPFENQNAAVLAPASQNAALLDLWKRILSTDIEADSDFFDLGGHSMLGIQMTAELNKVYGTNLGIKDLFLNSKFSEFASLVEQAASQNQEFGKQIPVCNDENIPLNATQQRMWYVEQLEEGTRVHSLPGSWAVPEGTNLDQLEKAFGKIISNNEVMRLYVDDSQGMPIQRHAAVEHDLKIPRRQFKTREEAVAYMVERSQEPIDISSFPLFILEILEVKGGKAVIYFNKHHMIWDGWSVDLFLDKLNRYYNDLNDKHDLSLTRYRDYGVWADTRKKGQEYQNDLKYWIEQFDVLPKKLEFPSNMPQPEELGSSAVSCEAKMESETLKKLEAFNKTHGITDFMFFVGCYYLFLTQKSGNKDIVIGTPMRGRKLKELDEVLGVFINVMPLRFNNIDSKSVADLFAAIKKVCVNGFAHSDAAIEDIVSGLKTKTTLPINQLFSVMFSFQNIEQRNSKLGNGDLEQIHIHNDIVHSEQLLWIKKNYDKASVGMDFNAQLWTLEEAKAFNLEYIQVIKDVLDSRLNSTPNNEKETFEAVAVGVTTIVSEPELISTNSNSSQVIIDIWEKHLGESGIEAADNFFALGGHSLLAIQVIADMNKSLNCQFKIRDILNGTVETLALKAQGSSSSEKPASTQSTDTNSEDKGIKGKFNKILSRSKN